MSDDSRSNANNSVAFSKMNSTTSNTAQITLGYTPIPMDVLEKSCMHILKWMNDYLPSDQLSSFPSDLIVNNGHQIYKMIEF